MPAAYVHVALQVGMVDREQWYMNVQVKKNYAMYCVHEPIAVYSISRLCQVRTCT